MENNGGEGKSNEDKTYDESEAKRSADEAKTSGKSDSKKAASDNSAKDAEDEGGMKPWIIVLIVVAGVVVLISVEVFVFEMVKLNKSSKK